VVVVRRSLASIFSMALAGCNCPDPEEVTERITATEEEVAPFLQANGELEPDACMEVCQENVEFMVESCELVSHDPELTQAWLFECSGTQAVFCTGRRPAGLASTGVGTDAGADPVGRWLAEAAHLEAASVHAFEQLADRLAALAAPATLVTAARRCAREEIEHARVMTAWARVYGVEPAAVRLRPVGEPMLEALALENAVEGCVRETWGALLAWYQAAHAEDPALRAALADIARDETRHAELARSIAEWLEPQLSESARTRIRAARDRAVAELRRTAGHEHDDDTRHRLGLPPRAVAKQLLERVQPQLWAA
jgi:hypothetical protein